VDRAVEHFLARDVEITIASMPDGVDPDEYAMQHGAEGFEKMIAAGRDVLSFKWSQMMQQYKASGDLTGQQKAVETYLSLLADARGSGAVDVIRWGSVLARVSRLTDIPIDDLHRRFTRKSPARPVVAPKANDTAEPAPKEVTISILPVREVAERRVLGMLLKEPDRWQKIKADVHPEDFLHESRRILAEIFWNHQQDVGEPVFAQFLADLPGDTLKSLAVELLEEMENLAEPEESFKGALAYFEEERQTDVNRKHMADIRRTTEESAKAATFAEFVKNNPSSNPRRLGPVRRFKSGS
jgi:DNA primase